MSSIRALLFVALSAAPLAMQADTIDKFSLSGTLSDSATLAGTISIDVSTNSFSSGAFSVDRSGVFDTFAGNPFYQGPDNFYNPPTTFAQYSVNGQNPSGHVGSHFFSIELPANTTPATFKGGFITGGEGTLITANSNTFDSITSASLSLLSVTNNAAPEASTFTLAAGALLSLAGIFRKRTPELPTLNQP